MTSTQKGFPDWLEKLDATSYADCDAMLFQKARQAYETQGRWYHTWQHIVACLNLFATQRFDNPRAVLLALLFHDAVYVPGRKDNEAKSAVLADSLIQTFSRISIGERQEISAMIALTAHHHAKEDISLDAKKLIDIDLAILGEAWPIYEEYANNVRLEFCPSVVPESDYLAGRLSFLGQLQNQANIFLTQEMRESRENRARSNIAREMKALLNAL